MRLLCLWTIITAVVARHSVASVDMSCHCRMWHLRDPSVNLHCGTKKNGTPGLTCQKASVPDIPPRYEFVSGYGLVKFRRTHMTWWAAKKACEADGSRLAIPPDQHAVDGLNQIIAREMGRSWAFIGISDEASEGFFVGVDGRPARFLPWQPDEPSDHEGEENCVNTREDGLYNDLSCDWQLPFFCERLLSVAIPESYRWLEDAGRFYKVHEDKLGHADAARACRSENATLAVIDTWRRAEALLRNLVDRNGGYYRTGLTDQAVEGDFVTETGRHLTNMEFQVWGLGEPSNNDGSDTEEDCLALSGEGYFNDVHCIYPRPFICEIVPT